MTKYTHYSQIEYVQLNSQISMCMKMGWGKVHSKVMLDSPFATLCSLVYLKSVRVHATEIIGFQQCLKDSLMHYLFIC